MNHTGSHRTDETAVLEIWNLGSVRLNFWSSDSNSGISTTLSVLCSVSRRKDVAKFFKMDGNFLVYNDVGGMVAAVYVT